MERTLLLFVAVSVVCGSDVQPSSRIAGGVPITGPAPSYLASIQYDGKHFCTGAVIKNANGVASGYVVTAAHCVKGLDYNKLRVRVGSNRLGSGGQLALVTIMFIHPSFNKNKGMDYDVAVLGVPGITGRIQLVTSTTNPPNTGLVVLGWGSQPNSTQIGELRQGTAIVVDLQQCRRLISTVDVTERMLCTTGAGGCYTDDGAPLVSQDSRQLWGIFSWSSACNNNGRPQVYIDVTTVIDFLTPFI